MPVALLFSPDFDGHRQIHANVLTGALLKHGFRVVLAGPLRNTRTVSELPYLSEVLQDSKVTCYDTTDIVQHGLAATIDDLTQIQDETKADLTIIAYADHHLQMLNNQFGNRKKRLRGRTVGIFFGSISYPYLPISLRLRIRRWKNLSKDWKTDAKLFHSFLLPYGHLLDVALTLDESFVSNHQRTHVWLPEIVWPSNFENRTKEEEELRKWEPVIERFKEKNTGRFCFFYFGVEAERRGFATLLRLAVDLDGSFVHCGRRAIDMVGNEEVAHYRKTLSSRDRYLETGEYIVSPACVKKFFQMTDRVILPYNSFFGSSGVMLQALGLGMPVLVPDQGLMAWRTKEYSLGITFKPGSYDAVRSKTDEFVSMDCASFRNTIGQYMKYQTEEQVEKAISLACLGEGTGAALPPRERAQR